MIPGVCCPQQLRCSRRRRFADNEVGRLGRSTVSKHVLIDSTRKVALDDYDPAASGGLDKQQAQREMTHLEARLVQQQDLLYGAGQHAVLIVLQGMDTSGKDGTIKHVMSTINPAGCQVSYFKQPTAEELAHNFLW